MFSLNNILRLLPSYGIELPIKIEKLGFCYIVGNNNALLYHKTT